MGDVITILQEARIPAIFVVAGILFIFLAIGGGFGATIITDKIKPKHAGITGALFLAAGIALAVPIPPPAVVAITNPIPATHVDPALAAAAMTVQPSVQAPAPTPIKCTFPDISLPLNARLTTCAWDFFNDGMYVEAITIAQECIDEFKGQAVQEQQAFTTSGKPTPRVGKPANDAEKNEILARGVLNDLATCYYITGRSLEKVNRISEAKEAYKDVQRFPDARTWDLAGFFWSPAQTATDRLATLP